MAKYMLIMRSTDESLANFANVDFEQMLETMGRLTTNSSARGCSSPPRDG